jgi:hypothetical protein
MNIVFLLQNVMKVREYASDRTYLPLFWINQNFVGIINLYPI